MGRCLLNSTNRGRRLVEILYGRGRALSPTKSDRDGTPSPKTGITGGVRVERRRRERERERDLLGNNVHDGGVQGAAR